jgi:recombinational DNA repair protein RecT
MNPNIKHIPAKDGDRSIDKLIATYGIVKLKNGEAQIKVCYRNEIDQSRASSRSSTRSDSPWNKHFEAMALVVPIRRMAKNLGLTMRADEFDEEMHEVQNIRGVA